MPKHPYLWVPAWVGTKIAVSVWQQAAMHAMKEQPHAHSTVHSERGGAPDLVMQLTIQNLKSLRLKDTCHSTAVCR